MVIRLILSFFSPQPEPQTQEKPEEKPQNVPSLLLGTKRETQKPTSLKTLDFDKFALTLSVEGAVLSALWTRDMERSL